MGCSTSKPGVDPECAQKTEQIDKAILDDMVKMRREVKMLLLGTGESGKSTILKQMQLIHGSGFSDSDRVAMRETVLRNLLHSVQMVIEGANKLSVPFENTGAVAECGAKIPDALKSVGAEGIEPAFLDAVKAVVTDSGTKSALARSNEFQIIDSAVYYFEHIDRITATGYTPNDQDILRSRVKTTGVVETTFLVDKLTFRMFDVGGQRSERKKWIHCFENVTAIVYMASLSEYDQKLLEDETQNRLHESVQLFSSICNSRWFTKTNMILFLNKIDLLREKLKESPISAHYPEYQGSQSYDSACSFFQKKFLAQNQSQTKEVYAHFTCATDTTQIRFIFAAVKDIILRNNLCDAGLM